MENNDNKLRSPDGKFSPQAVGIDPNRNKPINPLTDWSDKFNNIDIKNKNENVSPKFLKGFKKGMGIEENKPIFQNKGQYELDPKVKNRIINKLKPKNAQDYFKNRKFKNNAERNRWLSSFFTDGNGGLDEYNKYRKSQGLKPMDDTTYQRLISYNDYKDIKNFHPYDMSKHPDLENFVDFYNELNKFYDEHYKKQGNKFTTEDGAEITQDDLLSLFK